MANFPSTFIYISFWDTDTAQTHSVFSVWPQQMITVVGKCSINMIRRHPWAFFFSWEQKKMLCGSTQPSGWRQTTSCGKWLRSAQWWRSWWPSWWWHSTVGGPWSRPYIPLGPDATGSSPSNSDTTLLGWSKAAECLAFREEHEGHLVNNAQ